MKKLFTIALFSSPLFGLFTMLPMFIAINHIRELTNIDYNLSTGFSLTLISSISIFIFIQWTLNILLFGTSRRNYKKISPYLLSYASVILIVVTIQLIFVPYSPIKHTSFSRLYPFIGSLSNNTFIILILKLLLTNKHRADLEKEKSQLEITSIEAQHEVLKQQIHPHFLFNCLSNLKSLLRTDQERAGNYLETLSEFLRSSLIKSKETLISCNEEKKFLEAYLKLQKVRFEDSLYYKINIEAEILENYKIPVFSLQMLTENAIKHNRFNTKNRLEIEIYSEQEEIIIRNNKLKDNASEISLGIGLKNIVDRYKLLDVARPEITSQEDFFSVKIRAIKI